ncbi:MAG: MoxR family ATPase [Victivallales bacterium]|nr:MoxR family ATPase [Victivallales bacterium]
MENDNIAAACETAKKFKENIAKVFIGKDDVVGKAILGLLSGGHILLQDVPGVGKTLLAKAISRSIDGIYSRVQFTADLLPTDITGVTIYKQDSGEFCFRKGPVFANILLGDEINRATPRTQSCLLEAMEENQITVDGVKYELPEIFFVIATQNPIELEGTYPLPFSQMDRFITRLSIGYLDHGKEKDMLKLQKVSDPLDSLTPVVTCKDMLDARQAVKEVSVAENMYDYLLGIIEASRESDFLEYGASPRGSLDLLRYSQARALLEGRSYVLPDDIKHSAPAVLSHRVIVRKGTRLASASGDGAIERIADSVEVPI